MGHEVHIFAGEIENTPIEGVQTHLIATPKFPFSLKVLRFMAKTERALRGYDFDIVHGVGRCTAINVYNPHGGVEGAYLKQEFASIESRPYYYYKFIRRYLSIRHYFDVAVQKRIFSGNRVQKTIAISEMVKDHIIEHYHVPENRIGIVFNSVDLERFHPRNVDLHREGKRKELAIDNDIQVLLFTGNNFRLKGLGPLFDALAEARKKVPSGKILLLVAGRGQVGRYLRRARRTGVADMVRFLGSVPDMDRLYAASDIYVHPTFYDSCSLTVLEALATGLPVITTRFNGAADALKGNRGGIILDNPSDTVKLAEAILFYLDNEARSSAGREGRASVERFPPEYNINETLKIYYEVADRSDTII